MSVDAPPEWLINELDPYDDPFPPEPPWLTGSPPGSTFLQVPDCPCCVELEPQPPAPVRWAVPGVWDHDAAHVPRPPVSAALAALTAAVMLLEAQDPTTLAVDESLVDTDRLLDLQQRLRRYQLRAVVYLKHRKLYALDNEPSWRSWLSRRHPETHKPDLTLADTLSRYPILRSRVLTGKLSFEAARKVQRTLHKTRPHLDRPDGLIEGQPAAPVLSAIIDNSVQLITQAKLGTPDPQDPALLSLQAQAAEIHAMPDTQLGTVENALVLLAENIPSHLLGDGLSQQLGALLPDELQDDDQDADKDRTVQLSSNPDQVGGHVRIRANGELWELLHTALAAAAGRDPANPTDTASAAQLRQLLQEQEEDDWSLVEGVTRPRTRGQRLHDALLLILQQYLAAGLAGTHDKAPVTVTVTLPDRLIEGQPGALPARGGSGKTLPTSLIRRWWCDATITPLIITAGWTPLGAVHTQRTLTAIERKAALVQHSGSCAGLGCCRPGDPLVQLIPHHVRPWHLYGETSLADTILACDSLHQDLHHGKTVQLRNGKWLCEQGWTEPPNRTWSYP